MGKVTILKVMGKVACVEKGFFKGLTYLKE
jgi:hypothetical protein